MDDSSEHDQPSELETRADDAATTVDPPRNVATEAQPAVTLGQRLGRYVVLEPIGHGGMGQVLRAYDPKLEREVALKLLRRGVLDSQAQTRLVREARAMARVSCPNVVAVYDVEDTRSGVMLVMELVRGPTLRSWAQAQSRSWSEVVTRFVEAGRGLAAAHAEGLLHRDFKPGNVLVPERAEAKVTDFGLAKPASAPDSEELTAHSESGDAVDDGLTQDGLVMGTPRYMAPEQQQGDPLGPAVDQYAFCVALWEALASPPFRGRWEQLLDRKLEGPPAWPSSPAPARVVNALRRGLAPDPAERWPNMDALLETLDQALAPRSRTSGPSVATLSIVGLLSVGGLIALGSRTPPEQPCSGAAAQLAEVWDDDRRAAVQQGLLSTEVAYAEGAWARVGARLDEYAAQWTAMHTEACEATTVRGEQSAQVMDLRMACLYRARQGLRAVASVLETADAAVVSEAVEVADGLVPLSRCADIEALQEDVEPPPADEVEAVQEIRGLLMQARTERIAGRYAQAKEHVEQAQGLREGLRYEVIDAEIAMEHAEVLEALGQLGQAEPLYRDALRLSVRFENWPIARQASFALMYIVGTKQARPKEALAYRELAEGLTHGDPRGQARLHGSLALLELSQVHHAEAEAELRRGLALLEQASATGTLEEVTLRHNLSGVLFQLARFEDAEVETRRTLELRQQLLGEEHPNVVDSWSGLAALLSAQGKHEEAEAVMRRVLPMYDRLLGAEHLDAALARYNFAIMLADQAKFVEAEQQLRLILKVWPKTLPGHVAASAPWMTLGYVLHGQGRDEEAEAEYRAALELAEGQQPLDEPSLADIRSGLASVLIALGRGQEAVSLARMAWEWKGVYQLPPSMRADMGLVYARALVAAGEPVGTARAVAEQALELLNEAGEDGEQAKQLRAWLAEHP